jgi:hypothetical protein
MFAIPLAVTHVLPDSGSFAGDIVAVVIAVVTFAVLYWAISLFDRV